VTTELPVTRVRAGLVDRGDVLALAGRRWAEAVDGHGQFVLIAGEAGIGKSRMLDEIADLLEGVPVLTTRAWPRDAEFPGAVLFDLARTLRQEGRAATGDAILERLRPEGDPGDGAARYRLLASDLTDLVLEVLLDGPLLLRIEDLHWADELSLDVLERLAPLVRHSRSLVVATYRSDEMRSGSALATWRSRVLGQRFAEEVPLARLDRSGTVRLATALLGETPSATLVDDLVERSNGIPLYIEELLAAGGSRLVPDTIAEAVRERSQRLDAAARDLAGVAAVIGCSFEFDLLVDIVDAPEDPVDSGLRELCDHHLLVRLSETKFDFRHALLRDALYDDIPLPLRRRLHAAVAEASERGGIRRSYLSEQFEAAQLPGRAFPHAVAAADDAARLSAHREAAELYARALRTAPADLPRAALADLTARGALELLAIDDAPAADALLSRSVELSREAGDADAAASRTAHLMATRHLLGEDLEHRIALARDARGWLEAAPDGGSDAAWGRLLGAEAAAYMLARELDRAIASGREALARLRAASDTESRLDVQATLGAVEVFAGRDEGWALLDEVIAEAGTRFEAVAARGHRMLATSASVLVEYDRARRDLDAGLAATAASERWNDHHYLRAHRAHVRWATGTAGAEDDARRALADGRAVTTEIEARKTLGYIDLARDRLDDARFHLERALDLGRGMAELQRVNPALWGLAEAALHGGEPSRAVELAEEGYALSAAVGDAAYLFPFVLTGVRARLAQRDADGAREWLDRCRVLLELRGIPGTLPALGHAEGVLELAEGRSTAARPLLREAADAWTTRGRLWEGVQAQLDLARCAVRARRPGEAARFVAEARRRAVEAGATLLVRLADEVRLDADAGDAAGPLTAREFEVARLIADGATNREIAERLVIAPKTASAHVEHILAKLGVNRRAEVASWVSRRGEPDG
jgi:DNA-binding CsgD family transcriptional regulator